MHVADANQKLYICPGETVPITHAVHLGRLARMYPACQTCPLNCESGQHGERLSQQLRRRHERESGELVRGPGRIRGVYLNRITRRVAGEIVGRFAESLWTDINRTVRTHRRETIADWNSPLLVIGYDRRPSSPDIVTGVQDRLRLMGCDVVDLGLTTAPAVQFAVRLRHATGGVFVTGAGHSPAWTGLDFYDNDARPGDVSEIVVPGPGDPPGRLARPLRSSGSYRFQPVAQTYALRVSSFARPCRPLRVCVGVEDRVLQDHVLATVRVAPQSETAVDNAVQFVELPRRVRDLESPDDPDVVRVAAAVQQARADFGFVIDEDLRRCALIDDRGELATPGELVELLSVDSSQSAVDPLADPPSDAPGVTFGNSTYVFSRQSIQCDAAMTLARLLTSVSQHDRSVSDLIDGLGMPDSAA